MAKEKRESINRGNGGVEKLLFLGLFKNTQMQGALNHEE